MRERCTHHPIQRNLGIWPRVDKGKKSGFAALTFSAHLALFAKSSAGCDTVGVVIVIARLVDGMDVWLVGLMRSWLGVVGRGDLRHNVTARSGMLGDAHSQSEWGWGVT